MTGDGSTARRIADEIVGMPAGSLCALIAPAGYGKSTVLGLVEESVDLHDGAGPVRVAPTDVQGLRTALDDPDRRWLVVDGLDPVTHRESVDAIAAWVDAGPATGARVVLAGRSARLRGLLPILSGCVRVMEESDLSLGTGEAADLLLDLAPSMDPADAGQVIDACGGWVGALAAVGRWAGRHPGQAGAGWLNGRGSEEIVGRLIADLPEDEAEFLRDTALLDRLSASLCDYVRARSDSGALLARIDAGFGFLHEVKASPELADAEWWERHPILTAALRRMNRGVDLTDRHTRAADWFRAAGDLDSTMDHLMGAGRLREAVEVIQQHEDDLLEYGRAEFAQQWYERLGPDALGPYALHLLRLGWSRAMAGDRIGARAALEQLRSRLAAAGSIADESDTDVPGFVAAAGFDALEFHGEVHLLSSYVAMLGGAAREVVTEARRACDAFQGRSERNSHQLAPTLVVRGLLWCGDVDAASDELDRIGNQPFPSDMLRESVLAGATALTLVERGEVYRARARADAAGAWFESQGLDPVAQDQYLVPTALGQCLGELGETGEGTRLLGSVAAAAERASRVGDQVYALAALAAMQSARGELATALATVDRARQALLMRAPGSDLLVRLNEVESRLRIQGGDLMRAERLARTLPDGNRRRLLLARIAVHRQGTAVPRLLAAIQPTCHREVASLELLLATAAIARSTRLAETHLARAADVAHAHGMLMLLAGSAPRLLSLAEDAARTHADDRLRILVDTARSVRTPADGRTRAEQRPYGAPIPLSPGEVALLPLLASRDSNEQLAQRLGVSVNTVKTRLRRLYRKLGVTSRDEAVAIARARNLLA